MSDKVRPVPFFWNGDAMTPHPRFKALCNKQFCVGEEYVLTVLESASTISRNHYFASLRDVWMNLPEGDTRFPSEVHMRKYLLIKAGFSDEKSIVCDTARDANNLARLARSLDGYAVIVISGKVVKIYTAKTQSAVAMKKDEFQASKQAVLELAAELIGTTPAELKKHVGKAA
jgi:hypothetical protein